MKKFLTVVFLLGLVIIGFTPASGAVLTFSPMPADVYDFDHYLAFTWGIEWTLKDTPITQATLTFKNIADWMPETDDILYTRLLDNPAPGLTVFGDNQELGDYFDGQGVLVDTWSDPDDGTFPSDLTFTFNEALLGQVNSFASDGLFGFSFDPDCHYFNDGVELTLVTGVPEPSSLLLLGLGTLGLAMYRKRH